MPYSFNSPDDMPLPPPRHRTIPPLWHEIKAKTATPAKTQKAKAESATAAVSLSNLQLLLAHLAHQLTPLPGAIPLLRAALDSIWPVLFPHLAPASEPSLP